MQVMPLEAMKPVVSTKTLHFPSFFWGLSIIPSILLGNRLPIPVPVNQQALLSNITAFVTFLCIHNIEALQQA